MNKSIETYHIKCPCTRCVNRFYHNLENVMGHIEMYGFDRNYRNWIYHGENFSALGSSNDNFMDNVALDDVPMESNFGVNMTAMVQEGIQIPHVDDDMGSEEDRTAGAPVSNDNMPTYFKLLKEAETYSSLSGFVGEEYSLSKRMTNIYTHRRQIFRLEHKAFYFDIHDNGSKVIIKEMNRLHSYSIQIDFGGVKWLIEELKSAAYNFNATFKPKKYQASYAMFVMERYANKNGTFIRIVELRKSNSMNIVIFSAGIKGNGWRGIVASLQRILGGPPSGEKNVNRKEVVRNDQQVSSGRMGVSRLSYAEIVKNYELNKEDLTRGKQPADTMSVQMDSCSTPFILNNKPGHFESKKEEGLQLELDKGERSRRIIDKGGLQETRKEQIIVKNVSFVDQILENAEAEVPEDSDYGISSFGEVASSIGTIIEETQEVVRKEGAGSSHCNLSQGKNEEEEWVMKGLRKFGKGPVEEHLVQGDGTKMKDWNRLKISKLTRLKWSLKPIQTYKRREKECRATLNASDGEDSDKEDMIEDKWAEILLGNKQIDNNYLEEDIEFISDGDNMDMTDDEERHVYEVTSESNDEYVSNSEESENEISSDQNSINHYDGIAGWCGYLFYEENRALDSNNNLLMDKQDLVVFNYQLIIHMKENEHPTTSFRFGVSCGLLFTIILGDIRADLCISKREGAEFREHHNNLEDSYVRVREIDTEVDEDGAKIPIRNGEGAVASKNAMQIIESILDTRRVQSRESNSRKYLKKEKIIIAGDLSAVLYSLSYYYSRREENIKKRLEDYLPEEQNDLEVRNKIFEDVVGQDGHGWALCMGTGIRPTPKRVRVSSSSYKNLEVEIAQIREEAKEERNRHKKELEEYVNEMLRRAGLSIPDDAIDTSIQP
ncbi:hypothetical protein LguiB_018278 [Lonicera macranthoides]